MQLEMTGSRRQLRPTRISGWQSGKIMHACRSGLRACAARLLPAVDVFTGGSQVYVSISFAFFCKATQSFRLGLCVQTTKDPPVFNCRSDACKRRLWIHYLYDRFTDIFYGFQAAGRRPRLWFDSTPLRNGIAACGSIRGLSGGYASNPAHRVSRTPAESHGSSDCIDLC